ncbi:MAG: RNA polymerase sigma-70 factor [Saprospiraceae bacterium]|nr:RNA polymerase sigma-70 factor [Saprospiraceae bacterium]MBL0099030.1 RNA polymerase sigma-70 factor [Saprospiraceae bacterium]
MHLSDVDGFSRLIKSNPERALQYLYESQYETLCKQVYLILKDENVAEDIVQEVFVEVWKKREDLNILTSIEPYLKRACRNRALNYIRDNAIKWEEESALLDQEDTGFTSEQYMNADDLNKEIQTIISEMPEKCGIVFSLSRYEEMNYATIAKELGISVKTVENQISKALKILREQIYKKVKIE